MFIATLFIYNSETGNNSQAPKLMSLLIGIVMRQNINWRLVTTLIDQILD